MNRSTRLQTGNKYELWIAQPEIPHNRISIAIRIKEGTFNPSTNTAAVLLDAKNLKALIEDLTKRLEDIS